MLLRYEVTNALYRYARSGELDASDLSESMRAFFAIPITMISSDTIHQRALTLAARFDLAAAYDAHYLAVAATERLILWTGDRRLFNRVAPHVDWIRLAE